MNNATILLKSVHPTQVQNNVASSTNFRPNRSDDGKMSVYDGDLITPENAWKHRIGVAKKESYGIVGISFDECIQESLLVQSDPIPETEPVPCAEHALIDFTNNKENEWEKISKRLKKKSEQRGWLFQSDLNTKH